MPEYVCTIPQAVADEIAQAKCVLISRHSHDRTYVAVLTAKPGMKLYFKQTSTGNNHSPSIKVLGWKHASKLGVPCEIDVSMKNQKRDLSLPKRKLLFYGVNHSR